MFSVIPFSVTGSPINVDLNLPSWNTNTILGTPEILSVGQIGELRLDGSYTYFADVRPDNVDCLRLSIMVRLSPLPISNQMSPHYLNQARHVLLKAFGLTIRHLIRVRENYFGNFTNFSTRWEYLEKHAQGTVGDPVDLKYRKGKVNTFFFLTSEPSLNWFIWQSNSLQVSISLDVNDSGVLLPEELHSLRTGFWIRIPRVQLSLNLHEHMMGKRASSSRSKRMTHIEIISKEISINTHALRLERALGCAGVREYRPVRSAANGISIAGVLIYLSFTLGRRSETCTKGLNITGNRLFGYPPQNATYVCVWEIRLGNVIGSVPTEYVSSLAAAGAAFGTGVKDTLNSVAEEFRVEFDSDVTFTTVVVDTVELAWELKDTACQLVLPDGLRFDTNDLPGQQYASVRSISAPIVHLRSLLAHRAGRVPVQWCEVASGSFDVHLDLYSAPPDWRSLAAQKMQFVERQDFATRRVAWMYGTDLRGGSSNVLHGGS